MKIGKIALVFIISVFFYSCKNTIGNKLEQKTIAHRGFLQTADNKDIVEYANRYLGLVFALPNNYIRKHEPIKTEDLQENLKKIEEVFYDSLTNKSVTFKLYPKKSGETLYNLKKDLFVNTIKIADTKGIVSKEKINKNGKGVSLNPPIVLTKIDFYKKDKGYVQILITSEEPDSAFVEKVIENIRFSN